MGNLRLIGLTAFGVFVSSSIAYIAFAWSNLNGRAADWLWVPVVYAAPETILAWAVFALCGIAAYTCRPWFESRPAIVIAILVGLPVLWIAGVMLLYALQSDGLWPVSFWDEDWRWLAAITYAQFAFAMMMGSGALAGVALNRRGIGHSESQ